MREISNPKSMQGLTREGVRRKLDQLCDPAVPAPFHGDFYVKIKAGRPVHIKVEKTAANDDELATI